VRREKIVTAFEEKRGRGDELRLVALHLGHPFDPLDFAPAFANFGVASRARLSLRGRLSVSFHVSNSAVAAGYAFMFALGL
jgi:hypothetical protein